MLQICAIDIWPHCKCGYLYFYDTMMFMERVLSEGYKPVTDKEMFSLAAACLIDSFVALNRDDRGTTTLIHLLVHRLQRAVNVTGFDIYDQLWHRTAVVQNPAHVPHSGGPVGDCVILKENEAATNLVFLDLLDLIEGKENVPRPVVETTHRDCWSQYLSLASSVIDNELLFYGSKAVVSRMRQGTSTDADLNLLSEASILHRIKDPLREDENKLVQSVKQVLTFRTLAQCCPWTCLAPRTLKWNTSPIASWMNRNRGRGESLVPYTLVSI